MDASDLVGHHRLLHPVNRCLDVVGPDEFGDVERKVLVGEALAGSHNVALAGVAKTRGTGPQRLYRRLIPGAPIQHGNRGNVKKRRPLQGFFPGQAAVGAVIDADKVEEGSETVIEDAVLSVDVFAAQPPAIRDVVANRTMKLLEEIARWVVS